jgi:hypothetical protein
MLAGSAATPAGPGLLRARTRTVPGYSTFADAVNALPPGFAAATGFAIETVLAASGEKWPASLRNPPAPRVTA